MNFSEFSIREWALLGSAIFDLICAGTIIYLALKLYRLE